MTQTKRTWIAVSTAIVVVIALFFGRGIWQFFAGSVQMEGPTSAPQSAIQPVGNPTDMKNISTIPGIEIYDEVVGTGAVATAGKTVSVHYTGVFKDGKKFDSSLDRGQPFDFSLGAGQVIKGWDLGVAGMKVGGTRRLVISPELGYGPNDYGPIPGGSTLVFQVQLLGVK